MQESKKDPKWTTKCFESMQWVSATIRKNLMYENYAMLGLDAHVFCSNITIKLLKPWLFPGNLVSTTSVHVATHHENWN